MRDRPRFEVVDAETDPTKLMLTTVAAVQALMDSYPADAIIQGHIVTASALIAKYARLAGDAPTFAEEDCKATWQASGCNRGSTLILPWRRPITATTVTENDVELEEGVDYVLEGGNLLRRLSGTSYGCWSSAVIIVEFTAGYALPAGAPADLASSCADQVKYRIMNKPRDPTVLSENHPDVYSATYAYAGGNAVNSLGLLASVAGDIDSGGYRDEPIF